MGKIIAVANQKGGVGKSTTVINIAAYLGSRDFKVLCVDSDPQGNTTTGFGIKKKSVPASTYDVITGKTRIQDAIIPTEFKNVSIVPATEDLAGCELELAQNENRVNRLKMQLLTCKEDFDYIFIDCPPALGTITINGIVACDSVIVPMLAEFYALEGLSQLVNTIKIVKNNYNPALQIEGILFTMFDGRLNVANDVVESPPASDNPFNTLLYFCHPALLGLAPNTSLFPPQNVPFLYVTVRMLPSKSKKADLGLMLS